MSSASLSDVINVLERNNIRYNVDATSGTVMVDSAKINEAKLKLAAENLSPTAGYGFENIEKDEGFGTSSFLQAARYQRALEGELARTIASMRTVQSARVHLAIPKESAFIRNKRDASASVFIKLVPGHSIEKNQIAAITNLVASSIASLKTSQVTIVDDNRVERMLNPIVGDGNVRAQVTADIDYTQIESTQESFNPDLPAIRSEQSSEEKSQGAARGGIPGALTNQPPANAAAPEQATPQSVTTQQGIHAITTVI